MGTSALAMLRMSGPDTQRIAAELVRGPLPSPRVARHFDYHDTRGALVDDVVATWFAAPRSFTGEDSLEICCHGNPFIAQKILEDLLRRGSRIAEPGEFSQRAFLNGKMDLSQAEAVMDVIHARSDRALAAAQHQLRGNLSRRMDNLVEALLGTLARIEAYIDFPDEDLPAEDRHTVLFGVRDILRDTNDLLATSHYGDVLREGVKVVIIGAPNAGKSSLLNALVGSERALVSAEPGTTRDYIEERIQVGPHAVRIIDTAGLNPSPSPLERRGIGKTVERASEADVFLWVIDAAERSQSRLPPEVSSLLQDDRTIVVLNKSDLLATTPPLDAGKIYVSTLNGSGLDELRRAIAAKADTFAVDPLDLIAINARHAQALDEARQSLAAAEAKLAGLGAVELVASDLRGALAAFGEITGRIDNERMLDQLFATFCIGK
jgi:tRNA modification GTPase